MSEKHTAPKSNGELLQKWMNSVVAPAFVENQDNPYNYIKILNTGETDTGETEKIANFIIRNTNAFIPKGSRNNDMRVDSVFKYIYMKLNHPGDDIEEKNTKLYKTVDRRRFDHELGKLKQILQSKLSRPKEKTTLVTNVDYQPDSPESSPERKGLPFWSSIPIPSAAPSQTPTPLVFPPPPQSSIQAVFPPPPQSSIQAVFPPPAQPSTHMADSLSQSSPMSSSEEKNAFVDSKSPQLYHSPSPETTLKASQSQQGYRSPSQEEATLIGTPDGGKRGKKTAKRQKRKSTQRHRKQNKKTVKRRTRHIK